MPDPRLSYLFQRYLDKTASPDEREELFGMALQPQHNEQLQGLIDVIPVEDAAGIDMSPEKADQLLREILPAKVRPLLKRLAVAASVAALVVLGIYFFYTNRSSQKDNTPLIIQSDVEAPKSNRAMIRLADGSVIYLDSAGNGTLAVQDKVTVSKTEDGRINYSAATGGETAYNTLENPRGSKMIDLVLGDGTHIWLNAASSITYPVSFTGNERKVTITGEAYFEVAHNTSMPFIVEKGNTNVRVLGTKFNVNAYDDEENLKVTLLEGSVQCTIGKGQRAILEPGQQAAIRHPSSAIAINNNIDLEEVMAWKNGEFNFGEQADIKTVMREISRWYDVDVEYRGTVTEKIFGSVSRSVNVSKVLQLLERTGGVRFTIENKKVIVMP